MDAHARTKRTARRLSWLVLVLGAPLMAGVLSLWATPSLAAPAPRLRPASAATSWLPGVVSVGGVDAAGAAPVTGAEPDGVMGAIADTPAVVAPGSKATSAGAATDAPAADQVVAIDPAIAPAGVTEGSAVFGRGAVLELLGLSKGSNFARPSTAALPPGPSATGDSVTLTQSASNNPGGDSVTGPGPADPPGGGGPPSGDVDLTMTKTDSFGGSSLTGVAGRVTAGSYVTYTVVVTNAGSTPADGVVVSDPLGSTPLFGGDTYSATSSGGASGFSSSGTGSIDDTVDLPPGSSITYTVTAYILPSAGGLLTNTATLTPPSGEPNTGNDSAADQDIVTPLTYPLTIPVPTPAPPSTSVDLTIQKTDSPQYGEPGTFDPETDDTTGGTAAANTLITYTIVVANAGSGEVDGVGVSDTLPLSYDPYYATDSGGATNSPTCTSTAVCDGDISQTVDLPTGSNVTYTAYGYIPDDENGTQIVNTATLTPPAGDTNTGNNSSTDTVTVTQDGG